MPRAKKPGGGYSQRTDLLQQQKVPTGQAYGERQASLESQAQVPVANDPWDQVVAQAQAAPFESVGLFGPTQRPNEPITSGLSTGIGRGPEALSLLNRGKLSTQLQRIASESGNPTLVELAERAVRYGM